jgi:hypothetical protein
MGQERRKHSRIAFHAPATLVILDQTFEVLILDLSLKGALVRLPAGGAVAERAPCKLRVRLGDEMPAEITMEARIAYREGAHVGLSCLSIDLDSATHLHRLVELNLGDTALLDRELSELIAE